MVFEILKGSLINALAVILGSFLGLLIKKYLNPRVEQIIRTGCGFSVLILGARMAMSFDHVLLVVFCVILGGILGEVVELESRLKNFVNKILAKSQKSEGLSEGFIAASILFCTGSMAIIGSIESGVKLDHQVLYTKAILDGFICLTFTPVYGIGVALSFASVLLYQGSLSLLAAQVDYLSEPAVMNDLSGVGGILLLMIGIDVSGIKKIPVGQFLPAIILAMIATYFVH